jgi:hypothetical protein
VIPKPIVDVVEAARRFVRARFELREAIRSKEMNELGLSKRRKALRDAAKALDRAVMDLEDRLSAAAKRGARGAPIPWGSVFKAVGEFAGLVTRVKAGDATAVRDAAAWAGRHGPSSTPRTEDDIIDAEIIEE